MLLDFPLGWGLYAINLPVTIYAGHGSAIYQSVIPCVTYYITKVHGYADSWVSCNKFAISCRKYPDHTAHTYSCIIGITNAWINCASVTSQTCLEANSFPIRTAQTITHLGRYINQLEYLDFQLDYQEACELSCQTISMVLVAMETGSSSLVAYLPQVHVTRDPQRM